MVVMAYAKDVLHNITETVEPLIVVLRVGAGNRSAGLVLAEDDISGIAGVGVKPPAPAGVLFDGVSTDGQLDEGFGAVALNGHFGILIVVLVNVKDVRLTVCAVLLGNGQRAGLDMEKESRVAVQLSFIPVTGRVAVLMLEGDEII